MGRLNKYKSPLLKRYLLAIIICSMATILSGLFTLNAYISNSREAKKRYDALLVVDATGGDVEASLLSLRTYIYRHMNTTIGSPTGVKPPIQLKGTYDRLVAAEKARVLQAGDDLYNKAQKECERLFPQGLSGRGRVPCITEYVTKNAVKEQPIADGLYKYDFASPKWSPDAAGYGIVVTLLLIVATIGTTLNFIRIRLNQNESF